MSAYKRRSFISYENAVTQIQSRPLQVCLDLCLKINNEVFRVLDDINSQVYIEKMENNHGHTILQIWSPDRKHGFCKLIVEAYKLEENTLHLEVLAELEVIEFQVSDIERITVDSIMKDYVKLEPAVTKGTIHHYNESTIRGTGRARKSAQRTLKVRFRVFADSFHPKERTSTLQKITEDSIPYIMALYEISENLKLS